MILKIPRSAGLRRSCCLAILGGPDYWISSMDSQLSYKEVVSEQLVFSFSHQSSTKDTMYFLAVNMVRVGA